MQKKFIALAVAGLVSGAAFAQSNVTVYGVMDLGFDVASATGASSLAAAGANRSSFTRVNTNSSLIGFKGTEALGNGLNAIFQIESSVVADGNTTGANTNTFGVTRDTFVGLQSAAMGTVKLGLQTLSTRALGNKVDMNAGATGFGSNSALIGKTVAAGGFSTFDTRFANTVSYTSPTIAGGLSLSAAYVSGENKNLDSANSTAAQINTKGYDLGAIYENGPIMAGLTYGKVKNDLDKSTSAATAIDEQSIWRLAGTYTLPGGHKVGALYEQNKAQYATSEIKRNVWGISGKFMVSPAGGLIAQYYKANDPSGNFYASNSERGAQHYEIGYEHSLSKRTMVKASYARIDNKDNAAYDSGNGTVGGGFGVGANPTVISAGLRHSF